MNDTAIRNYCIWARNELLAGVEARMRLYGVAEGAEPAGAAAVGGRALSPEETGWRDALLRAGGLCAPARPRRLHLVQPHRRRALHGGPRLPALPRAHVHPPGRGRLLGAG